MEGERPAQVVLRVLVMKFSPAALVRNLFRFATGAAEDELRHAAEAAVHSRDPQPAAYPRAPEGPNAMTFAPVGMKKHGAQYVIDAAGVAFTGAGEHDFRLTWAEVRAVRLQLCRSQMLGLHQLRFVWHPVDPAAFPVPADLWDDEQGGYVTSIAAVVEVPYELYADTVNALTCFAGDRWDGQVEQVQTAPQQGGSR